METSERVKKKKEKRREPLFVWRHLFSVQRTTECICFARRAFFLFEVFPLITVSAADADAGWQLSVFVT